MSPNDLPLPSVEMLPLALPVEEVPPIPPVSPAPARSLAFPLHPGFWAAIFWCLGMLLFTQVPGGIVSVVLMVGLLFALPGQPDLMAVSDPAELLGSTAGQLAVGAGLGVAHVLMIVLSLITLRVVVGRDWRREVAFRRPSGTHTLLVLISAPAFVILANAVYRFVQQGLGFPGANDLPGAACFLSSLICTLALAGAVCLTLWLTLGQHWGRRLSANGSPARSVLLSALALTALGTSAWMLYRLALPTFRSVLPDGAAMANMEEMEGLFNGWPVALAVLFVAVLPALSEELWCRAFIGRGLVGVHGVFWGVLLTSFLFGLIHVDPCQGTMAMVLGVCLHGIYLLTRSLLLPMLLHFLNNALAVTLPRVPAVQALDDVGFAHSVLLLSAATLLLLAVGTALYRTRARLVSVKDGPAWQPAHAGVACPPADSGTLVVSPGLSPALALLVVLALAGLAGAIALALAA